MINLRLVTFNTWNCQGRLEERLAIIEAGLKALDADIILLQEVFSEVPSGRNVADHLGTALNLNVTFAPARKKMRVFQNAPTLCHSGLAVLSKNAPLDSFVRQLPQDERDGERLAQYVRLQFSDLSILVANTHLSHLRDSGKLRRHELESLIAHLKTFPRHDLVVLGGDMNADETDSLFEVLDDFTSFPILSRAQSTLNADNDKEPILGYIDHIFVTAPDFYIEGHAKLSLDQKISPHNLFPSDHKAVVLDISISTS